MTLLDRVKKLCTDNSMTLAKLEKTLGFGNGTLSRWDDSSPSGDKLLKVANFFNISVDYLLGSVDYVQIGERIKNVRSINGISLEDMAKQVGLNKKLYMNIEKGLTEPSAQTIKSICNILDLTIDELLSNYFIYKRIEDSDSLNEWFSSLDNEGKAKFINDALNDTSYILDGKKYKVQVKKIDEYEKESKYKNDFINMCNMIGYKCSSYNYKNVPGFIVINKSKQLFISIDNIKAILDKTKDFFFFKLGEALCYSDEIEVNVENSKHSIDSILNAAHADGEPTEEEIQHADEIMNNDANWD